MYTTPYDTLHMYVQLVCMVCRIVLDLLAARDVKSAAILLGRLAAAMECF